MSVNLEKESSLWGGLFKPKYRMSLFGLYNIDRSGDIEEIKNEINGFIDPISLGKRYAGFEWSLKNLGKNQVSFEGHSTMEGEELSLYLRSSSKEGIFVSIENLKDIFNLLRVRLPQSLKIQLKTAKANVTPIRQSTQFSCVSTSTCMALNSLGVKCTEEDVNKVIGAKPMQGARWEEVLACAQYFGCRATLTTPATLTQVKQWTDAGKPVLIAWNPEGREWSHASLIFDVTGERGNYLVHIADPNIPNPDKTVREVSEDEFYGKWYEKWPDYLVRRPALMIEKEITLEGKQVMASIRIASKKNTMVERIASRHLRDNSGAVFEPIRGMEGPIRFKNGMVLYYDPRENGGTYYNSRTDMYLSEKEMDYILAGKYGWEKEAGARDKSSFLTQPLRTRYDYGERVSSSFNDLDQDKDGKISPSEWEEGFDMIDRDDSGFISEEEWDNPNFDDIDQDDDGLISRDEWAEGFDEIDEDDDGLISEEEFYSRKANELNEMDDIIDDLQDDLEEVEGIVDDLQVDEDFSSRFVEDFDSEIAVSKSARFHAGPEGRKEWEEWKENNPNAADEFDAQTEENKDVVKDLVRGKKAHRHHGSYMSLQNIREMSEFLYTLEDQVHEGEELEDWVEDKISHAHATLSDLHRFFGFGGGYHTHDDE